MIVPRVCLLLVQNGKETGGRIARWALALAEYDYEIEYIKGTDNTLADLLSRMVVAENANTGVIGGPERQTKPKVQLAAMTPDILGAVALCHMHGYEKIPDQGFDPHEVFPL